MSAPECEVRPRSPTLTLEESYVRQNLSSRSRLDETRLYRQREISRTLCLVGRRSRVLLGRAGTPHRLDQTLHKREKYLLRAGLRLDQMVRGRNHKCRAKLYRPAFAPARKPHRDHLGTRRSEGFETYHLQEPARRGLPSRQCPQ